MPRFSIITPSHDKSYLNELFQSLRRQTEDNWEWVLLYNGRLTFEDVKQYLSDPRVRLTRSHHQGGVVGALKMEACDHARGEILVEVDHDDYLLDNCLEELDKAFQDPLVGFVYSNDVQLGEFNRGDWGNNGWKFRDYQMGDKVLTEVISFEPSAASVGFIWYAPDHVRAWRKEVYERAGKYDPSMFILDDQDLIIRTYLTTTFKHIDKPLYVYRRIPTSTSRQTDNNRMIQTRTIEIYNKYAYRLAERDADLNRLMKIDLCGAFECPYGYKSIDKDPSADIVFDLDRGIPLPENTVGVIRAHDALEHLNNKRMIMEECHRVLVDGGWLMISVPSTDGRGAFQDPTHVSYWNQNSFWYWTRKEQARYIHNDTTRFQDFRLETLFPSEWHKQNNIPYTVAYLRAIKSSNRRPKGIHI